MSEASIPESRAYRHVQCGSETVVGDESFKVVSNPMSSMERTFCSSCGTMFPIAEYEWADTGENLAEYYARHTQSATDMQRLLCSKKSMMALIGLGVVLTAAGFYSLVRNDAFATQAIVVFTGVVIGAVVGGTVFTKLIEGPITRKVCGVSDTRLLT